MKIRIAPGLSSLLVPIDSLTPYPGNPREGDVEAIRKSIRRFGVQKPIVVQEDSRQIVAGNHLWLAMKEEGATEIPASLTPLSDEEAKAYLIADNRTAELGGYNEVDLAAILRDIRDNGDLDGTGYSPREVEKFLARVERETSSGIPELAFSEELMEEHQYVVLYTDTTMDWNMLTELLGIRTSKAWDATDSYLRAGLGRVVKATDAIARIRGVKP